MPQGKQQPGCDNRALTHPHTTWLPISNQGQRPKLETAMSFFMERSYTDSSTRKIIQNFRKLCASYPDIIIQFGRGRSHFKCIEIMSRILAYISPEEINVFC